MATLSVIVSSFCQGSQGGLRLDSITDPPGYGLGNATTAAYSWTVENVSTGASYGGPAGQGTEALVPDGQYRLQVLASYDDGTTAESEVDYRTVNCGGGASGGGGQPGGLTLDSLTHTNPATVGGTGTVTLQGSGGTGQLYASIGLRPAEPITAGQPHTFLNVAVGTYLVDLHDSATPNNAYVRSTVTIDDVRVGGCTDPAATNLAAGATFDDGSCVYAPPPALPAYLAVPLLQTLRFVVRGALAAPGVDATLFCEQPRAGQQVRPYYFQLVERGDQVRVQVLTSYAAVTATVRQHTSGQPVASASLQQVLTLEGPAAPLSVVLSEDKLSGLTRLSPAQGTELPASLLAAPRLTLAGAAQGTYRLTQVVPGSVLQIADYVVLNRPWAAPGAGAVTASWLLSGAGFNVWEADLPLAALPDGAYQVQLRATRAGLADVVADSEPLLLRSTHPDTLAVDFTNGDNCYRTVFSTGLTPRLRVRGTLFRQKNGGELTTYSDSAANSTVLASTATRVVPLETYGLPAWLHEKLYLACRLDYLRVGGTRYASPAAYEYELPRAYPLGGGHADLQQLDWLGAGNGHDPGLVENAPANALQLSTGEFLVLRGQ